MLIWWRALFGGGLAKPMAVVLREMAKPSSKVLPVLLLLLVLKVVEFAGEPLLATEAPCKDSGGAIVSPPELLMANEGRRGSTIEA